MHMFVLNLARLDRILLSIGLPRSKPFPVLFVQRPVTGPSNRALFQQFSRSFFFLFKKFVLLAQIETERFFFTSRDTLYVPNSNAVRTAGTRRSNPRRWPRSGVPLMFLLWTSLDGHNSVAMVIQLERSPASHAHRHTISYVNMHTAWTKPD